jgi:3-hydroxybutyrate dehydrogenase
MNSEAKSLNIFVTGGASGIGFGIAEYLAKKGHHIIVADINIEAANLAAQSLNNAGFSAQAIQVNVCDAKQVAALPAKLSATPVDILVNNAGIQHVSRLEDFPAEKWQMLINVMLVGPALLTQAFLPHMREQNFGRIINVGSIHSVMALETGDVDVTINTLCPAYVKTPLVEQQIAAQAKENNMSEEDVVNKIMLEPMPKKAFIEIEELAQTAEFLIGSAAKNITGQTLILDGGWTAR